MILSRTGENGRGDGETMRMIHEGRGAPWYKTFMCYFDVVKRIPKGTSNVFNQPLTGDMEPVPGEEHRSYAGPTPWPVLVIYKDQFTKSNVTDVMLLHLQLGHANIHKLKAAQEQYGTNNVSRTNPNGIPYCRPITSTDVIYCAACHTATAKKVALPSKPSRTSINTKVLDPQLETQTQERATSFGDLVYCDYIKITSTWTAYLVTDTSSSSLIGQLATYTHSVRQDGSTHTNFSSTI